jgi:hypothetical protein
MAIDSSINTGYHMDLFCVAVVADLEYGVAIVWMKPFKQSDEPEALEIRPLLLFNVIDAVTILPAVIC